MADGTDHPGRPGRGEHAAEAWTVPGYTDQRELGAGAGGRVVLGVHTDTGASVAIKYLAPHIGGDDGFRRAFRQEARLLGGLASPHVTALYEYVEAPDGAAIVMEPVDGPSLRALLRQEGPTGPEAALCVLKGSLLGLADAHRAGVVHRDFKPGNVLVTREGATKLTDFGIAVRSGERAPATGTPAYMAPEQWDSTPPTASADVYAATATFYECLTGRRPFSGGSLAEIGLRHATEPVPLEGVPEAVRELVRRGMAKDPRERPQDAAAFVQELEAAAGAGYGADWEERGQRRLAALAALLPLLFRQLGGPPAGGTEVATTVLAGGGTGGGTAGGAGGGAVGHAPRRGVLQGAWLPTGGALLVALLVVVPQLLAAGAEPAAREAEVEAIATTTFGPDGSGADGGASPSPSSGSSGPEAGESSGTAEPSAGETESGGSGEPGASGEVSTPPGGGTSSPGPGTSSGPVDTPTTGPATTAPERPEVTTSAPPTTAPPTSAEPSAEPSEEDSAITSVRVSVSRGRTGAFTGQLLITTDGTGPVRVAAQWYLSDNGQAVGKPYGDVQVFTRSGERRYVITLQQEFDQVYSCQWEGLVAYAYPDGKPRAEDSVDQGRCVVY